MTRRLASLVLIALSMVFAAGAAATGGVSTRIVGPDRQNAVQSEWPFITFVNGGGAYLCGGSVINARWILTAAHCRYDGSGNPLGTMPVYPGAYDLNALPARQVSDAVLVHPSYVWSPGGSGWDFLLLRLPAATGVMPIALQAPSDDAAVDALRTNNPAAGPLAGLIAGWGRTTDGGSTSDILQHANGGIPILTDGTCATRWGAAFEAASMVCAGGEPTSPSVPNAANDTCNGDSGGPLAAVVNGRRILVGATSWGGDCGDPAFPGVYAKVSAVRGWVCDTVTSPTAITVAATSATSALVAWTPDTTTCPWNNPTVQVSASPGGASASVPLSAGGATLTGLTAGTTYTVSARVTSSGATPPAATSTVAMPAAPAPAPAPTPTAVTTPPCSKTFYQQDARTARTQAAPDGTNAVRVVSRLRIYEDAESWCRVNLTFIFRNKKTGARLSQLPGSTLGYRKLTGKDFSAPVVGWPTAREFKFVGSDSTGLNRRDARLVLVSYLRKTSSTPAQSNIELMVVRRIPQNAAQASSTANPLFAQKNVFGTGVGWATVS